MKSKLTPGRVIALKGYTIKTAGDKFFVAPTGMTEWNGPYKSLQHATTAIARKLAREFTERRERSQRQQQDLERQQKDRRHG